MELSEYETVLSEDGSEWASDDGIPMHEGEQKDRAWKVDAEDRARHTTEEAQLQHDLFAKIPRQLYATPPRMQKGLLSQLLNPDPRMFPPDHPYRRQFSSQDAIQYRRRGPGAFIPLPVSKGSVALPQAAAIVVQTPRTNGIHASCVGKWKDTARMKKGRPPSTELEDSESEDELVDNGIPVSRSVAQQKLAALMDLTRRLSKHKPPAPEPPMQISTTPIPLHYPYNLPAPTPPMTPRTTRRQMLSTELPEGLRRNLLWERQVSRGSILRPRRQASLANSARPITTQRSPAGHTGDSSCKRGEKDEAIHEQLAVHNRGRWEDDYHYVGW